MNGTQKHLGVKLIDARPMTRGDYNKYKGWEIPENEDPTDEGCLVIYPDGYESWSPKDVFDKAYRPITGLTYGLAIEALKKGHRVCRSGWNGKGMFVFKQIPAEIGVDIIPNMQSVPYVRKRRDGRKQYYLKIY